MLNGYILGLYKFKTFYRKTLINKLDLINARFLLILQWRIVVYNW